MASKFSADDYATTDNTTKVLTIAEAMSDPYGIYRGGPNVGVIAGPAYAPTYKQALSQSKGIDNSTGSEGPDMADY